MMHKRAWGLVLVALVLATGRGGAEAPALRPQLVRIGDGFATVTPLRAGDEVRVRVKVKGDGIGDAIVLSAFTPAQIRLLRGSERGEELTRWSKRSVEEGQVLVYTLAQPAHIGVELRGVTNSRMAVERRGNVYEMVFTSIGQRWELEVKFTAPEF